MINAATCNASVTSGCGQTPSTAQVGSTPGWVAVNPATHSVYVVEPRRTARVSVIDSITCNATDTRVASRPLPAMAIGFVAGSVEVDRGHRHGLHLEPGRQHRLSAQRGPLQREPHLRAAPGSRRRRRSGSCPRASRRTGRRTPSTWRTGRRHGLGDQRGRLQRAQQLGLRPGLGDRLGGRLPPGRCGRSGHGHDLHGERVQRREHGLGDRRANLQRR